MVLPLIGLRALEIGSTQQCLNSGLEEEAPVTKTSHGHRVLLILHAHEFFYLGFYQEQGVCKELRKFGGA